MTVVANGTFHYPLNVTVQLVSGSAVGEREGRGGEGERERGGEGGGEGRRERERGERGGEGRGREGERGGEIGATRVVSLDLKLVSVWAAAFHLHRSC